MGRGGADTLEGVGLTPWPARTKVQVKWACPTGKTHFSTPYL